jgi:hypothetical protein
MLKVVPRANARPLAHISHHRDRRRACHHQTINYQWSRAQTPGSLAPYLSPPQIAEVLNTAMAIGDEDSRAQVLGFSLLVPSTNIARWYP